MACFFSQFSQYKLLILININSKNRNNNKYTNLKDFNRAYNIYAKIIN